MILEIALGFGALFVFGYFYTNFFQDVYHMYVRYQMIRTILKYRKTNYTIVDSFHDTVRKKPEQLFLRFGDETFTFRQADELSNKTARVFLQNGVGKGDVVAIYSKNSPMFVWLWLGLAKIGGVGAFLNVNIRAQSLLHCFKVSKAKILVAAEELQDAVEEVLPKLQEMEASVLLLSDCSNTEGMESFSQKMEEVTSGPLPQDIRAGVTLMSPMIYIYTSGTTGLPKAALITYLKLWGMTLFHISTGRTSKEVLYISLPMYHTVAFLGLTGAIHLGSIVALRDKFSASNFWSDCKKYDVNTILYIGETMRYLCNSKKSPNDRNHNVKLAIGNGIRADTWREFLKRFGDITIREFYGATEGNFSFVNYSGKIGAIGKENIFHKRMNPYALVKYDIDNAKPLRDSAGFCVRVPTGEPGLLVSKITLQTPFLGYAGDQKQTDSKKLQDVFEKGDKYFNTGDVIITDKEGFVYFHDRAGDTFRWKGENVATTEVADTLTLAECIKEANVYGVTVPGHEGRAGMAAITLTEGHEFDTKAVFRHVENLLPTYAQPLFIRVKEHLDVTGTFKYQKVKLRDEGFDPRNITDTLYFRHTKENNYVPLTLDIYDSAVTGAIKF